MAGSSRLRSGLRALNPAGLARDQDLDALRLQTGWLQSRVAREAASLGEAEFKVFSQFGEDGIIQFLTARVEIENDTFVELGVEDYSESNTRFLLTQDNWRGVIIDAAGDHAAFLHENELSWRHQIDAVQAFIDRDNVNSLIRNAGVEGDIGLLSIDLDGNDYWILEAIDVVSPRILVVEYNSAYGADAAVTIPYAPAFRRLEAHYSGLYFGASLAGLQRLAEGKGYALVGCGASGANAFFVRRDVLGDLRPREAGEAYVASRFRESRGPDGELTFVSARSERLRLIADLPLLDLDSGAQIAVRDIAPKT
jgi:hypothetical protein